jgi:hypothetical protein
MEEQAIKIEAVLPAINLHLWGMFHCHVCGVEKMNA